MATTKLRRRATEAPPVPQQVVVLSRTHWLQFIRLHERWSRSTMVRDTPSQMLAALPQSVARVEIELQAGDRRHIDPLPVSGSEPGWGLVSSWLLRICTATALPELPRRWAVFLGYQIACQTGGVGLPHTETGEP
jgi:hypothetical protein